jgi:hypothetical protein
MHVARDLWLKVRRSYERQTVFLKTSLQPAGQGRERRVADAASLDTIDSFGSR